TISEEPKAETYLSLLNFALHTNSLFSLVWRDHHGFHQPAFAIEEELRPNLVKELRTDEWPGTRLLGHFATVRLYRMSPEALSVLAEAKRLYAWVTPKRPEDLSFYVSESRPWFGSIAHERDSFVFPGVVHIDELAMKVQGLRFERSS